MARYRVEFCREWILGRWGFTDRLFHDLGGKVTEPSRLENAWLVDYRGNARNLGKLLSEALNIQEKDYEQFGAIFEIQELSSDPRPAPRARATSGLQ
jgi:hypothetical protein